MTSFNCIPVPFQNLSFAVLACGYVHVCERVLKYFTVYQTFLFLIFMLLYYFFLFWILALLECECVFTKMTGEINVVDVIIIIVVVVVA